MKKSFFINNQKIKYSLKRSGRARRVRLAVYCDASVVVTLPNRADESVAQKFIKEKIDWLLDKIDYFKRQKAAVIMPGGRNCYLKNRAEARRFVLERIAYFNRFYKFQINRISIKAQKSRWGSCSKKRNLNYNYKVIFLPPGLADYIIVHELCHLKEFNHAKSFWALVEQTIPDYKISAAQMKNIYL